MKLAIISDVHGNVDALDAVLDDARAQGADEYLLLGDYIFDMPFSQAVVRRLRELPRAHIIKGNKEGYLDALARQPQDEWTALQLAVIYQTYRELSASDRAWLSALPERLTLDMPSGRRLCAVHALSLPESAGFASSGEFSRLLDAGGGLGADMARYLSAAAPDACARAGADIVAFGHTHLQGCGCADGRALINPGACGQPMDGEVGAPYALLSDARELRIELRRPQYDVERAIERARATSIARAGDIWSEIVFRALRSGRDEMEPLFAIARRVAAERGQTGGLYSNDTFRDAFERLRASWDD